MQQSQTDSIEDILRISDTVGKIDALNFLAYKNRYSNPQKSIDAALKAKENSIASDYEFGLQTSRMHLAFAHFILSKEYPILQELTDTSQYFKNKLKIPELPIVLNYLGNVYDNFGEYQKGLSLCHESLKYAQDYKLREVESDVLSTIGLIMSRISDFNGAIESFKKSYDIRKELNNAPAMASSLNLLARTYALNCNFELSELFYNQAIELRLEINEMGALPWSYVGLASLYAKMNEREKALEFFNKSLDFNQTLPDKRCSLHCYIGLSRLYLGSQNYDLAKSYVDQAIQTAQELNANPLLYEAYEILATYFENLGDYRQAFECFKKFHQTRESVLNAQTHSKLKNQQVSFEIEKVQKDAEIYQLRNIELKNAYSALEKRTHEILDSIDYAKNIQNALLPPVEYFQSLFQESFIYYNPKDIVSGDFYWCHEVGNRTYVAVADCTGHGVPGAFMSMLGISLLNEIINSCNTYSSDELLNELRSRLIKSLRQSTERYSLKDGMDIALCCIDKKLNTIEYSGAFNPLYVINNNKITEIKANRMPIGIFDNVLQPFTKKVIPIEEGMMVYMFSDGFMDQFGGSDGKKLKASGFRNLILKISQSPMADQRFLLDDELHQWIHVQEQLDDILVMGIRF
jgi:serine phosphatase RsbU (regulator of sigma subunit)